MPRLYKVQINLDDAAADLDTLSTDSERGEWLRGFLCGARGAANRFTEGTPAWMGHNTGANSYHSAVQFSLKQSATANKRWCHGNATAMPRHNVGIQQPDNVIDSTVSIQESDDATEMPRHSHGNAAAMPNQYPITNNQYPITNNQKPVIVMCAEAPQQQQKTDDDTLEPDPRPKGRFVPPTVDEVDEYCTERVNNVDAQRFVDYYEANGWKVGRNRMKDWRAAVRTWERNNQKPKTSAIERRSMPPLEDEVYKPTLAEVMEGHRMCEQYNAERRERERLAKEQANG
jgi:hypothetical protein